VVLDPIRLGAARAYRSAASRPGQPPAERLARFVEEAGLAGVRVGDIAVRAGVLPSDVSTTIAAAGKGILSVGDVLVARRAIAAEVERLAQWWSPTTTSTRSTPPVATGAAGRGQCSRTRCSTCYSSTG